MSLILLLRPATPVRRLLRAIPLTAAFMLLVSSCSSSSSSSSSGSPAEAGGCETSGSFTMTLTATYGPTQPCPNPAPPTPINVTYASDGSGTVNGETCQAQCRDSQGVLAPCPAGQPITQPAPGEAPGVCEILLSCTGNISVVDFHTDTSPPHTVSSVTGGCPISGG